ncbi:MAG: hypothetical protein II943_04575 [Victivallales bacterium]|nr:hypothetical protein [Victivallales bacterium]
MKAEPFYRLLSLVAHLVLAFYGTVLMLVAVALVELPLSLGMDVRLEGNELYVHIIEGIQIVACALVALFFAIRHWRHLPPAPDDAPKSRSQSYLLWGTCAFSLLAIGEFIAIYNGHFDHWGWWAGALFLLVAPIVLAVAWPFRFHAKHNGVYVVSFAGALLLTMLSGCSCGMLGAKVDYSGDHLEDAPNLLSYQREYYFPEGATKYRIVGRNTVFCWECQCSEEDFLKFAESHWHFNKVSEGEPKKLWWLMGETITCPAPYYFFQSIGSNGRGVTMCYCISTQTLYGNYSDH